MTKELEEEFRVGKPVAKAGNDLTKMKALVFEGPRNLAVRDLPIPGIRSGHCLIRVAYLGICGADAAFYKGSSLVDNFPVSQLVTKNVEVYGVLSGLAYWKQSLDLAANGALRPIQLLDRVFPYSEAPAAFEYLIRTDRSKPKLAISFEEQKTLARSRTEAS